MIGARIAQQKRVPVIHVNFKTKEVASRVSNIDDLARIGRALSATENANGVMVYFEFENAANLLLFCRTVSAMGAVNDVETLEKKKKDLEKEIEALEVELGETRKKVEKRKENE